MATATLHFVSVISAGSIGSPENALNAPDGVFTADTTKQSWTATWAFDAVTGSTESNGTHTITIRARKHATGGSDVTINSATLYQGATSIPLITTAVTVSSAGTGQDVIVTFDGTQLSGLENVSMEISGAGAGGGPNERGCEIDAVTWDAQYTAIFGTPMKVYQSGIWVQGYLKYYDGVAWVGKTAKVYQNGTWVIV